MSETTLTYIESGTTCEKCQNPLTVAIICGARLTEPCPCSRRLETALEAQICPFLANWRRQVPAEYQETPNFPLLERVLAWSPGQDRGLAVVGPAGTGKTTSVAQAARHWRKLFRWANGTDLTSAFDQLRADDQEVKNASLARWGAWGKCKLLILDDLDKAAWSPEFSKKMYELLEKRKNAKLPLVWTGNAAPNRKRMDPSIAEAVGVRLLRNFTQVKL